MSRTQKDYKYIEDQGLRKQNINTTVPGSALVTTVKVQGSGISATYSGVDTGTGDVVISVNGIPSGVDELIKITNLDNSSDFLTNKISVGAGIQKSILTDNTGKQTLNLSTTATNTSKLHSFFLSREGDVETGKWLKLDSISTDKVPYIIPHNETLVKSILTNEELNTGTIRIFKNGVSLLDLALTNQKNKITTHTLSFNAGDTLSAKGISGNLEDVVLEFIFEVI